MKSINNFINEPLILNDKGKRTDEFFIVGTLLAGALLAQAVYNFGKSDVAKSASGMFASFFDLIAAKNNKKREELSDKEATDSLLAAAKKSNDESEDSPEKEDNEDLFNIISTASYDEDGNEIPFEERDDKLKTILPENEYDDLMKSANDKIKDAQDNEDLEKSISETAKNLSEKDIEDYVEQSKKDAVEGWKQINNKEDKEKEPEKEDKEKEPEKDKEGNVIKQEEVVDKETGKKIKVKTHTGPRGGKFYYPDGVPKTPEHKVYVESCASLSQYIKEELTKN